MTKSSSSPQFITIPSTCPDIRTGTSKDTIKKAFLENLFYVQGRSLKNASTNDLYMALAFTIRDRLLHMRLCRPERQPAVGFTPVEYNVCEGSRLLHRV